MPRAHGTMPTLNSLCENVCWSSLSESRESERIYYDFAALKWERSFCWKNRCTSCSGCERLHRCSCCSTTALPVCLCEARMPKGRLTSARRRRGMGSPFCGVLPLVSIPETHSLSVIVGHHSWSPRSSDGCFPKLCV